MTCWSTNVVWVGMERGEVRVYDPVESLWFDPTASSNFMPGTQPLVAVREDTVISISNNSRAGINIGVGSPERGWVWTYIESGFNTKQTSIALFEDGRLLIGGRGSLMMSSLSDLLKGTLEDYVASDLRDYISDNRLYLLEPTGHKGVDGKPR